MCVCYGIGGGSVGIRFKGPVSLVGGQRWSTGYGRGGMGSCDERRRG